MATTRAINVKIATVKVIAALEEKLKTMKADKANEAKARKAYETAREKYRKDLITLASKSKVEIVEASRHTYRDRGGNAYVTLGVMVPIDLLPEEPKDIHSFPDYQYNEIVSEIENAIRLLKMTDQETVSTSTYNSVAKYL